MNLTLKKSDLSAILSKASSVTENKATMPILASVLLDAQGDTLTVSAYDLEVAYVGLVGATVTKPGKMAVSAKALGDVVRSLPEEVVELRQEKTKLVVTSGSAEFRLSTTNVEEYPALPEGVTGVGFSLDGLALAKVLGEVAYAQSHDETRYSLNGTFLEGLDGRLCATSTDGHRLAHVELPVEGVAFGGVIVSRKTSSLLRRVLVAGEVHVEVSENAVFLTQGNEVIVARLIDGQFPDYRAILPEVTGLTPLDRKAVLSTLGRMKLVAEATTWSFGERKLTVSAMDPDLGDVHETLDVDTESKVKVGVNGQYVRETLSSWVDDYILVQVIDDISPIYLRSEGTETSWAVVMPMRVK